MTELLFVIFHEKTQQLEVVVRDAAGRKRRVELQFFSKDPIPIPKDWWDTVLAELKLQDDEEKAKSVGRVQF